MSNAAECFLLYYNVFSWLTGIKCPTKCWVFQNHLSIFVANVICPNDKVWLIQYGGLRCFHIYKINWNSCSLQHVGETCRNYKHTYIHTRWILKNCDVTKYPNSILKYLLGRGEDIQLVPHLIYPDYIPLRYCGTELGEQIDISSIMFWVFPLCAWQTDSERERIEGDKRTEK